jgi:hypothetical protein
MLELATTEAALSMAIANRDQLKTLANCTRWQAQFAQLIATVDATIKAHAVSDHHYGAELRDRWSDFKRSSFSEKLRGVTLLLVQALKIWFKRRSARESRARFDAIRLRMVLAAAVVPRDRGERDSRIAALQAERQRLVIDKREVSASRTQIRRTARGARAGLNGARGGFARWARVAIATSEQRSVQPLDSQHHALETRRIMIERELLWLRQLS